MSENTLRFITRLGIAFAAFFRLLFDGQFAAQVVGLAQKTAPALPTPPAPPADKPPPVTIERDLSPALQLLELLQREGRFIDFIKQDIVAFSDGDVGAAARIVHQGCRHAVERVATIEVVRKEPEGGTLTLEAGFDAKAHRLVGNVQGQPPYRGVLKHRGWRVTKLTLEEPLPGAAFAIVAPAEIEL